MRTPSTKAESVMRPTRISTVILTAGLMIAPSLIAQTAPDIALPAGDASRGKAIFEGTKANCQGCHRVNGAGSLFGPDLSAIGAPRGGGGGGRGGGGGPAPVPPIPGGNAAGRGGQQNAAAPPTPQQFAQSILDPNAVVSPLNRYVVLKMKDGKTITGKLLSVDTFAYQVFDSTERLQNVAKENVRESTMTSPMPSYRDKLTTQELSDVISYLTSLRGQ
jgi:mono/diheme cytochrome c family protein